MFYEYARSPSPHLAALGNQLRSERGNAGGRATDFVRKSMNIV